MGKYRRVEGKANLNNYFAMTITIDKLGRIVVPKPLRDELNLRPGTVLEVEF